MTKKQITTALTACNVPMSCVPDVSKDRFTIDARNVIGLDERESTELARALVLWIDRNVIPMGAISGANGLFLCTVRDSDVSRKLTQEFRSTELDQFGIESEAEPDADAMPDQEANITKQGGVFEREAWGVFGCKLERGKMTTWTYYRSGTVNVSLSCDLYEFMVSGEIRRRSL